MFLSRYKQSRKHKSILAPLQRERIYQRSRLRILYPYQPTTPRNSNQVSEANALRISASALAPFGYTGIPTLTINSSDPVILFGDQFLRMLKDALMDCARHSSLINLAENIHTSMRIHLLLRGLAMRSKKYGVSNVRITYTPEHQVYLDWDDAHCLPQYQLLIAHI